MLTSQAARTHDTFDNEFWPRAQAALRAELGDHRYGMWIAPLRLKFADDACVVLACPTQFLTNNVREKYGERIGAVIALFTGKKRAVRFEPLHAAPMGRDPQPLFSGSEPPEPPMAERRITVEQVKRRATEWYKLQPGDLESRSRKRDVVRPRQIATYVARLLTKQSFPQIARKFGPRDHTTILHGCQLVADKIARDPEFAADVTAFMHSVRDESPS